MMIERQAEGQTLASSYAPYQRQAFTMPVQQKMLEGDYFDWDNEEEVHNWRHLSLSVKDMNNSESYPGWKNVPYIYDDFPDIGEALEKHTNVKSNIGNLGFVINTLGNNKIIFLHRNTFGLTQSEWIEKYPDLIVELYYKLKAPERLAFTQEQKEANKLHKKLKTYKTVTHIDSSDEVSPELNVTYYKNLDTILNNIVTRVEVLESEV